MEESMQTHRITKHIQAAGSKKNWGAIDLKGAPVGPAPVEKKKKKISLEKIPVSRLPLLPLSLLQLLCFRSLPVCLSWASKVFGFQHVSTKDRV